MIGTKIHELRLKKKMSLSMLAKRADVAKSYLSTIERNLKVNPSIQLLEKLAAVLEVDVRELLGNKFEVDQNKSVDKEWVSLLNQAIAAGVSKEQFRLFKQLVEQSNKKKDQSFEDL